MDTSTADTDALDRADMAQLVGGDDLALNRLMERHAPAVIRFLEQMLANAADARDLAQETFARVHRARVRYRPTARFSPWLFTIAANLARNHLRWRARHPGIPLDQPADGTGQALADTLPAAGRDPRQAAVAADQVRAVRAAVAALPGNMRTALTLCTWEDLGVAEAARVMAVSPKAVESLLYRARQQLRERLQSWW